MSQTAFGDAAVEPVGGIGGAHEGGVAEPAGGVAVVVVQKRLIPEVRFGLAAARR